MNDIDEIILDIQKGDKEKYRFIIEKYQKQVFTYIFHLVGNVQDAEDIIQDVFLKAYDKIGSYRYNASFSAWLYRIAYNHSINFIKRKKLIRMIPVFNFNLLGEAFVKNKTARSDNDTGLSIKDALNRLSPEERSLIILRVLEDKSYEEICSITDIKPETLRKRYERAKNKIRAFYATEERRSEKDGFRDRTGCKEIL